MTQEALDPTPLMTLDIAMANITSVVRAFVGTADQHQLLAQSLRVVAAALATKKESVPEQPDELLDTKG